MASEKPSKECCLRAAFKARYKALQEVSQIMDDALENVKLLERIRTDVRGLLHAESESSFFYERSVDGKRTRKAD